MLINPNDYVQLLQITIILLMGINIFAFVIKRNQSQFLANIIMLAAISIVLFNMFSSGVVQSQDYLYVDKFSELLALLVTVTMLLINILSYGAKESYRLFAIFSSFALMGMYFVAFAASFIMILLGLELMIMPTIFAILSSRAKSTEAAVKLFIISALSISLLTFGIALFYGGTNSVSFIQAPTSKVVEIALMFIIASLGFEASLSPFNLWVPDTYELSPTYLTGMLGGINKKVGFIALMEVVLLAFVQYEGTFSIILSIIAIITMFYGNIVALSQNNVKRLIAYSAISQSGYILIGIAVASQYGISASIFQIIAHSFMFIGAISIVAFMEQRNRIVISDYIGLFNDNKFAAASLSIFFLGFIGTPFTIGFIGKFMLFSSAIYGNLLVLALIGIVNSIISVYYYLKVIMSMFTNKERRSYFKMNTNIAIVVAICLIVTIALGIYPQPLISATGAAASALFAR